MNHRVVCRCKYKATARALPIPLVPPVTKAVLPFKPKRVDKYDSIAKMFSEWRGKAPRKSRGGCPLAKLFGPGINFTSPQNSHTNSFNVEADQGQ
jgi:hypothetical protein